jgi:peptide/nickel transport system permease protein
VFIGIVLGGLAGFLGGWVDQAIMRATDTLMSIPTLLLVIVFVSATGPSLFSVLMVIGLLGWPGAARLVRGQLLTLREAEFITAARVVGVPGFRIITRHLLPNILSSLAVLATFGVASAIILEASLSFLGLGVRIPTPSWGGMINEAQSPTVLLDLPWLWLAPGAAIAFTVLAVNFIGDGLRDALDPRSTRRT